MSILLSPVRTLDAYVEKRFQRWMDRRIRPQSSITLNQNRVYIMPNRFGLGFALLLLGLLIGAINYENNLAFLLTFMLASMFVVSIMHTFRNLSGLSIRAGGGMASFLGEDARFTVIVSRRPKQRFEAIRIGWPGFPPQTFDLIDDREQRLHLYARPKSRGRFRPGRLKLETFYPVSMIRAWAWVDLDMESLVYPRPVASGPLPDSAGSEEEGEHLSGPGADDYAGLRDYQPGDSLRHIAWKSYARGRGLYSKEFEAHVDRRAWIDWEHFAGMDREARLSRMCYWVLQYDGARVEYGLRLPGEELAPGQGDEHRQRCLRALALFECE